MTITHVTFNSKRQQWQYARGIPKELRSLFSGKVHFQRHWLRDAPRANTPSAERAAISESEPFKQRDDLVIARLDALSDDERQWIVENGGLSALNTISEDFPKWLDAYDDLPKPSLLTPRGYPEGSRAYAATATLEARVALRETVTQEHSVLRTIIARAQAIALKAEPPSEFSFDGLLSVWVKSRGQNWRGRKDNHERTVRVLKEVLGNIDYRYARQEDHAVRFRDALEKRGGYSWQTKHLERASAMYAAAVNEGTMRGKPNPFSGISVRGTAADADDDEPDLFTAAQMHALIDKAREIRFGDTRHEKRHTETMWLLEVMTYSGMRPNEVLQLQRGDVYVEPESGVSVMHIHRKCCVTGKRHDFKSMKNPKLRDVYVPLHPKINAFFDYADGADKAEFIFACFPYTDVAKKRRGWFDTNFGKLLKACNITPKPGKKLSLYSIRHSFHRAMDNAKIDKKRQRVITSHAPQDVHDGYSRGAELALLARDVAKVDPLG